jgi:hypothetical protein
MRWTTTLTILVVLPCWLMGASPSFAAEVTKSYDFALHAWHEIDASEGPVTLHRLWFDKEDDRVSKSTVMRPFDQEYLTTVQFKLEYTNEADSKCKARISARWLDEEGRVIDGFSAKETLGKKSARKRVKMSTATLEYGLERAKTLEVTVQFEP